MDKDIDMQIEDNTYYCSKCNMTITKGNKSYHNKTTHGPGGRIILSSLIPHKTAPASTPLTARPTATRTLTSTHLTPLQYIPPTTQTYTVSLQLPPVMHAPYIIQLPEPPTNAHGQ